MRWIIKNKPDLEKTEALSASLGIDPVLERTALEHASEIIKNEIKGQGNVARIIIGRDVGRDNEVRNIPVRTVRWKRFRVMNVEDRTSDPSVR